MTALNRLPAEAAHILGVGRTALFGLLKSGRLRSVKLGGCRFVTADAILAFVRELEEQATRPADAKAALMADRKPNRRSSIYLGGDGWWHGWVTVGTRDDGSPDPRHRKGRTEAEVTRKVQELERQRDTVTFPRRAPASPWRSGWKPGWPRSQPGGSAGQRWTAPTRRRCATGSFLA